MPGHDSPGRPCRKGGGCHGKGAAQPDGATKGFAGSKRAVTDRGSEGGVLDTAQRVQVRAGSGGSRNQGMEGSRPTGHLVAGLRVHLDRPGVLHVPGIRALPTPMRAQKSLLFSFPSPSSHFPTTNLCLRQHWCEMQNLPKISWGDGGESYHRTSHSRRLGSLQERFFPLSCITSLGRFFFPLSNRLTF